MSYLGYCIVSHVISERNELLMSKENLLHFFAPSFVAEHTHMLSKIVWQSLLHRGIENYWWMWNHRLFVKMDIDLHLLPILTGENRRYTLNHLFIYSFILILFLFCRGHTAPYKPVWLVLWQGASTGWITNSTGTGPSEVGGHTLGWRTCDCRCCSSPIFAPGKGRAKAMTLPLVGHLRTITR